ncbi:TadE/TadG family type IV pilus assembly protein [Amycolatopsis sp. NPDC059657]|uniref:TadE/TadG family type IV pilus assembly protein n=1 Tax=Amycolatopsis sp. NPDC059657 TaxID=3346899 RepID=UPI00366DFAB5
MTRQRWNDEGSVTVELAVLALPVLAVLLLMIVGGRIRHAGQTVDHAATTAARAASIARSAADAHASASSTANRVLGEQGLHCQNTTITVDATGFAARVGTTASVRVDVRCSVALSDLALPGLPGTRELSSTFTSPLDPFRARR